MVSIKRKQKRNKNKFKSSRIYFKKNNYKNYQQYYAVLSGGYIYFYYDNYENDYIAYYHLKNCDLKESEEEFSFKLSSNNGSIELKLMDKKVMNNGRKILLIESQK